MKEKENKSANMCAHQLKTWGNPPYIKPLALQSVPVFFEDSEASFFLLCGGGTPSSVSGRNKHIHFLRSQSHPPTSTNEKRGNKCRMKMGAPAPVTKLSYTSLTQPNLT